MSRVECTQFVGRRKQICEGTVKLPATVINQYRVGWGLDELPAEQLPARATKRIQTNGDAASRRPCSGCGGPPRKTKSDESFAAKIARRAQAIASAAVDFVGDGMTLATEKQQEFRKQQCDTCPINVNGWCDDSRGGCGCFLAAKRLPRAAACPLAKWSAHNDTYRPLSNPTRSLMFHLYPLKGKEWNWHWHVEQIRKHQDKFNGKIVIGVGLDKATATLKEVQAAFRGIKVDEWVVVDNTVALAETLTYVPMMRAVQTSDPNAILFRYHTKGVTKTPEAIEQDWARLLWEVNMDLPSVEDALASHLTCGAMRSMEPLVTGKRGDFFFAGSAYWCRAKETFNRDWQHTEHNRWWVEYVPGHLFARHESACMLHDLTLTSVIRKDHFDRHIRPEWEAWRLSRGLQ